MEKQSQGFNWKHIAQFSFLGLNAVVLFFFWFGVLTDYSWYYNVVSFWFSVLVLVLCVSLIIFFVFMHWGKLQLFVVFFICLITFPAALFAIPLHRSHSHEIPVQVELSPDGTRSIEVYCSFTRAHNDGFDHIEIIVRENNTPFLQRDLGLYNNYTPRHCVGDMDVLVHWKDNNTIYVVERQAYLHVGYINWGGVLTSPGEINGNN